MFLKRLETVGFKSFAERIKMDFVPGVTAIVGPNGSGKSNIIDAVRWVLGEQSAKSLRGQKMEDIIFQGSDTRNPLNFAEVALILNNEAGQLSIDYQEVSVTRRVYRSGESEFLINNQACRLKDIIDLFMDTGLGRESFSIIGQGKIDEILSSKAEERRAVFEEAAGVLKYKQRKMKAEFKLVETADNLDRVEDIIYEIEQQIEPLQKQAEVAENYKEKKSALKQVEVALLVTEIELIHNKWQALLSELEHDKDTERKERTKIQQIDSMIETNRYNIQKLDEKINNLQNELLHLTEKIEQIEGKRNVWVERSRHRDENKQKLKKEQHEYEERLQQLNSQKQEEEEQLKNVTAEMDSYLKKIEQLNQSLTYSIEDRHADIENKKSDYIEYLNQQAVLQNEKNTIENEIEQNKYNEKKQTDVHQETLDQETEWKKKKEYSANKLEEEVTKLDEKEILLTEQKDKLKNEREVYHQMQQKLYEGNEQIAKLTSRKDMLTEMRDAFQGYFYGVKEILRAKQQGKLDDILGTVVDLLDVPTMYMTAVDTVLGAQAQYIVVENDQIATQTIEWLKRENKGRATFLPLKSIATRQLPSNLMDEIRNQPGFIGIAAELIHCEKRYEKVSKHLLGNVLVTENLNSANQIARLTGRKYRIVTLDGDMVFPGGSMSGGAKKKNNQSLFSRDKEVQVLTDKIENYSSRAMAFEQKVMEKKQYVEALEQTISETENSIQHQKEIIRQQQLQHQDIELSYRAIANELSTYHLRKEEQDKYVEQLNSRLKENKRQQKEVQEILTELDNSIKDLTSEAATFQEKEKRSQQQLHELEIKRAELEERKKHHSQQLAGLQHQLRELTHQVANTKQQLNQIMDENELQQLKEGLEKELHTTRNTREQVSQDLEEKRKKREELNQVTEDAEREVKGLYLELEKFSKVIQEKEVQANRLDVSLENSLTTLQKEYIMTYEKAATLYEKVEDVDAARDDVNRIKQEIKQLGTVNLGAIEEYKRLSERYSFLKEQQDDLIKAKTTLYDVIHEMDEVLTARFSTVFREIQDAFTVVFEKLFGGGYAALKLTEPDNMLETGIDIIARPPGKKLKTLGLLSGGERALTAIALLFAILEVRPVPFCILDEVDAALDEANVGRFGTYLQSFSKKTQFIVITHRKGTMEEADALYGITMQESGVSRLVSVKLEETNELVKST